MGTLWRWRSGSAATVLAALAGVVLVAVVAHWSPLLSADAAIARAIHRQALASPALRHGAAAITSLGSTGARSLVTVLAVLVLLVRRAWRPAAFLALVVPLGGLLDTVIKLAVNRARPALSQPFAHAAGSSFPSGHAMGSTVTYGALLLVTLPHLADVARAPARVLVVVVVALVGASRVVLGVHWPSDVLGGWLLGLAWLLAAATVSEPRRRPVPVRRDD